MILCIVHLKNDNKYKIFCDLQIQYVLIEKSPNVFQKKNNHLFQAMINAIYQYKNNFYPFFALFATLSNYPMKRENAITNW